MGSYDERGAREYWWWRSGVGQSRYGPKCESDRERWRKLSRSGTIATGSVSGERCLDDGGFAGVERLVGVAAGSA